MPHSIRTGLPILALLVLLALYPLAPASAAHQPPSRLHGPIPARVLGVVDGDTLAVRVQVWIGQEIETNVRILGIDTPEMHSRCQQERALAKDARTALATLLKDGTVMLYDIRNDKYAGRVLAQAKTADGRDISAHMIEQGLARPYEGQARKKWC